MPKKKGIQIYLSRKHVAITLFVIILPFVFLLLVSRIANLTTNKLLEDLGNSSFRLFVAYLIAVILGFVLAISFYRGRRAIIALPVFDVFQSFPTSAILPLSTFFLGSTSTTVIFILVITVIWPILFSTISTLKLIKHDWEEAAEVAGLRGLKYLRYFLLPASVPGLITGSIIGLGDGWEAIVATEIIVGLKNGLGGFFQSYVQNITVTAFGVLGFLIFIFSINKLIWLPLLEWGHQLTEE